MDKGSGIFAGQTLAVHTEVVDTQALCLRKQLSGRAVSRSRSRVLESAPQDRGRPGGGEGEEQGRSTARTANVGLLSTGEGRPASGVRLLRPGLKDEAEVRGESAR